MKNWILAALFIVMWNECELKWHWIEEKTIHTVNGFDVTPVSYRGFNTVEIAIHTIKLATQKDVDLFLGQQPKFYGDEKRYVPNGGLINDKSFNIQVTETKE